MPRKLFFSEIDGTLHTQVVISTKDVSRLDPMQLTWVGAGSMRCDYRKSDKEEVRVIDISVRQADLSSIDVANLEVSAAGGLFTTQIPCVLRSDF